MLVRALSVITYGCLVAWTGWALLGPAVCQAICTAPAEFVPSCHAEAEPESENSEHDDRCCDTPLLAKASVLEIPGSSALVLPVHPLDRIVAPAARVRPVRELPRPPNLDNSPYLRVTPPRLVYVTDASA